MKENSIEEDIKDIKKYISFTSKRENFSHDTDWNWNKDLANKIEHVLSDYKRVLKENEELKLKEKRRIIGKYGEFEIHDVINRTLSNDYISVKKIKDKIEELNSRIEIYRKYVEQEVVTDVEWVDNVADRETVKVLQELINEEEET